MKKVKLGKTYKLFVLPILICFFAFNTFPLINAVVYSLTDSRGFGDFNWVGFQNYFDMFKDSRILNSYLFTFILPSFGKLIGNEFLSTSLLSNESTAWFAIIICTAWQAIAFNTIIYISGLQTIPGDVYEAAAIDGASPWQKFWHISFPLIAPFFTINMVLCMKNFLMAFDQIVAMTGGGPNSSTESISYLIYKTGLSGSQFGYQCANSVIYFIVIVLISVFQMKFLNKREVQL